MKTLCIIMILFLTGCNCYPINQEELALVDYYMIIDLVNIQKLEK